MSVIIKDFDAIKEQLRPKLRDLLVSSGFDIGEDGKTKISCLNKKVHEDKDPSMSIWPDSGFEVLHCFSCKANMDIFDAYAAIKKTPVEGQGWLVSTFIPLCDMFGIKPEFTDLSVEDKRSFSIIRAYQKAYEFVQNTGLSGKALEEAHRRKWDLGDVQRIFGVGNVDFKEYCDYMFSYGYSRTFLEEIDLLNNKIFFSNGLTIPIRDDLGCVVGFVTRNLDYDKNSDNKDVAKFYNTSKRCPIYNKGSILFNFDRAKSSDKPLYITESYMDCISMVLSGIDNSVALGSLALTDEHIKLLDKYRKRDVILAMDNDVPGQEATAKYVMSLSGSPGLNLRIFDMPKEWAAEGLVDPEEIIIHKGIDAFKSVPLICDFEWKLKQDEASDIDPFRLAMDNVAIIVNDPSILSRENKCHILSRHTGIDVNTIKEEMHRLLNLGDSEKKDAIKDIITKMVKELSRSTGDAPSVLTSALLAIEEVEKANTQTFFGNDEYVEFLDHKKLQDEAKETHRFSSGFPRFDDKTVSQWAVPGTLIALGGRSNSGKTAFLVNLAYNIATLNKDVTVLFHSIDDSRNLIIPKFLACISGIKINHINNPTTHREHYAKIKSMNYDYQRDQAYTKLKELALEGKLIIKDNDIGSSLSSVDRWIKQTKKQYKNRTIFYFLDNFHLLTDMNDKQDERVKNKERSKMVKNIVTRNGITMFMTVEYLKLKDNERPQNSHILETGQVEYDCNAIFHMNNSFIESGGNDVNSWSYRDPILDSSRVMPRIELITGKSKISGYRGSYFFNFIPELCQFTPSDTDADEDAVPTTGRVLYD